MEGHLQDTVPALQPGRPVLVRVCFERAHVHLPMLFCVTMAVKSAGARFIMKIGCHLPNQGPLATGDAVITFAREAEKRHIASLWVSDHVIFPRTQSGVYPGGRFPHPPDKPYLEPVTVLAAAAVVTTRARLGASVFILGHRHPVLMAKMLTS